MDNEIKITNKKSKFNLKKILYILLNIFIVLSGLTLIFLIYRISGVEDKIRYIVMGIIFLVDLLIVFITSRVVKHNKKVLSILFIIFSVILLVGQLGLSYFVYRTYSSLDNMNKDKITYTTVLIVKSDSKVDNISSLKNKKIGIVTDKTSIDGYVLALEIIKDENLNKNATIIEYETNSELIKDLYNKKIDAAIISKNYPSMFKSIDGYSDVADKTKIIYEKSKTLNKDEIAKYTGEDVINFNTSDSIDKPFTLLVMGIDSEAENLAKNASGNGDALMLVTFNPKTLNATILSIPRDTYVPIACFANQRENKITHAAWQGESCMIRTIQNFTGIDIDYYVKINFRGVIKLVNALGGIEVDVPIEFCESDAYRSTDEEDLVCLKKGKQTLNGDQALALARHRKTLLTGDLQRGVNQQLVVQGMLNKIKSVKSTSQLLGVLDAISNSMDTNFSTKQILSFYSIAKTLMNNSSDYGNFINMTQLYLQGHGAMIYDEGIGLTLYDFIPSGNSLNLIVKTMKQNLELEKVEQEKSMTFDIEDPFEMETIGADVYGGGKSYSLLPSFIGESESYARSWLSSHGISVTVQEKEVADSSEYFDGQVLEQSYPENKRLDLISEAMELTVAKITSGEANNTETPTEEPTPSEPTTPTEPEDPTTPTEPEEPTPTEPEEPTTPEENSGE